MSATVPSFESLTSSTEKSCLSLFLLISISEGSRESRATLNVARIYLYVVFVSVVGSTSTIVNPPTNTRSEAVFPSSSVTVTLILSPYFADAGTVIDSDVA